MPFAASSGRYSIGGAASQIGCDGADARAARCPAASLQRARNTIEAGIRGWRNVRLATL
jgi:hypothetical protein